MTCFSSADESAHYGFSVCMLLDQYRDQLGWERDGVVELGSGDATAISDVVSSLPGLRVQGFDISEPSVEKARENIRARGVADRYTVELGDFFDRADSTGGPQVTTVISNPPYIPAPDRDILMPELWGGERGNDLTLQLLKAGYDHVVTAVASYADPVTTVATATDLGDYFRQPMPRVRPLLAEMVADGTLLEVAVEGWDAPAPQLTPEELADRRRRAGELASEYRSEFL